MIRVHTFLDRITRSIARGTARLGKEVLPGPEVLDRSDSFALNAPGLWSANGSCRLIRTRDGWIAANLPRAEDLQSVPALLHSLPEGNPWDMLAAKAPAFASAELTAQAELLSLAVAAVGETPAPPEPCAAEPIGSRADRAGGPLRAVDFSSLWAGPLCGAVFAAMGAEVVKIESADRPDTTREAAPKLDQRLNGYKQKRRIALSSAEGAAQLVEEIARADVLITSARQRALASLGLTRDRLFADNPGLIWVAVTGHGWTSNRIAFGDDAAAAGGLVAWEGSEPRFLGDAVADPLTGLAAADRALQALGEGDGAFIDAALAGTAAHVAAPGQGTP